MKNPLDVLNKRQFVYLGDIAHQYYKFPGKYHSPCFNEYPSVNGSALRMKVVMLTGRFFKKLLIIGIIFAMRTNIQ